MNHQKVLPAGSLYYSNALGGLVRSKHDGKLIRMWGDKGVRGLNSRDIYYIPLYSGLVGEYVEPDRIALPKSR